MTWGRVRIPKIQETTKKMKKTDITKENGKIMKTSTSFCSWITTRIFFNLVTKGNPSKYSKK